MTDDSTPKHEEDRPLTVRDWKLERKALVSDLRLMIIASVALNQFLANVSLPKGVGAVAIGGAVLSPVIKAALVYTGVRS